MKIKNQTAIKKQLKKYCDIQNKPEPYLNKLSESGYCYGISLVRAAMRVTGKLTWWEEALDRILEWDGQANSLKQEHNLTGADEVNPISLEVLFERVIHYIVFNHAQESKYPYANLSQYFFLRPGGLFLLQKNKEVLGITNHYSIPGYFTENELSKVLDDQITMEAIKKNICLVHGFDHSSELGYIDDHWYFFDPNYLDGKAKSFDNPKKLVEEMINTLGNHLSIELACTYDLKEQPFSYYYDDLLIKHPEKLIQDHGLNIISQENSDLIPVLLNKLELANKLKLLNLNIVGPDGWTALMSAAENGHVEAIKALCANGALPNQADEDGWTALMSAAKHGHVEAIKALCENGALPNQAKKNGWTALMSAANHGHVEAIKALCENGAIPNQADEDGWTALMSAAKHGHVEAIKALCENGALPNQANKDGLTPLMIADQSGHFDALNQLRRKQGKLQEEQQRKLQEEQQRKLQEEQQRKLQEEQQRKLQEEQQRKLQEEQRRKLQEEQQRKLQEEQQRKLQEEQQRKLQEEQQRKLQEEQQRKLQEEQQRKLQEEQQRKLQEEQQEEIGNKIRELLNELSQKIEDLNTANQNTDSVFIAKELKVVLEGAVMDYENNIRDGNMDRMQARELFTADCAAGINHAKPLLENELGWKDALNNLLKAIANCFILVTNAVSGSSFTLFASVKAPMIEEIEKIENTLPKNS